MSTGKEIMILDECQRLVQSLQTTSEKFHGPVDKDSAKSTRFPFILLLGNHSSGKSSFINYILQRKVQKEGVAPTDDNFTIIAPGPEDVDRDGPTLVGDPDWGFDSLKQFGPMLVHRTQLKIRTTTTEDMKFMVVDTPGMIDSPVIRDSQGKWSRMLIDRGYDFEGVCQWYGERADVILLFFDPDKPGTTGETLSILTSSLVGLDHKLHIILNKADQFTKIHDFARAYGSLCWNLSKVIQRKDLPQIHTMCLPKSFFSEALRMPALSPSTDPAVENTGTQIQPSMTQGTDAQVSQSQTSAGAAVNDLFSRGFLDLEASRNEVMREVFNAPKRRVDHQISRLSEAAHALLMHCKIMDATCASHWTHIWHGRSALFGVGCASIGSTAIVAHHYHVLGGSPGRRTGGGLLSLFFPRAGTKSSVSISSPTPAVSAPDPSGSQILSTALSLSNDGALSIQSTTASTVIRAIAASAFIGAAVTVGAYWWHCWSCEDHARRVTSEANLNTLYSQLYAREIAEKNEFTLSLWNKVLNRLKMTFPIIELQSVPRVKAKDIAAIERVIECDIAQLRRQTANTAVSLSHQTRIGGSATASGAGGGSSATAMVGTPAVTVGAAGTVTVSGDTTFTSNVAGTAAFTGGVAGTDTATGSDTGAGAASGDATFDYSGRTDFAGHSSIQLSASQAPSSTPVTLIDASASDIPAEDGAESFEPLLPRGTGHV